MWHVWMCDCDGDDDDDGGAVCAWCDGGDDGVREHHSRLQLAYCMWKAAMKIISKSNLNSLLPTCHARDPMCATPQSNVSKHVNCLAMAMVKGRW